MALSGSHSIASEESFLNSAVCFSHLWEAAATHEAIQDYKV